MTDCQWKPNGCTYSIGYIVRQPGGSSPFLYLQVDVIRIRKDENTYCQSRQRVRADGKHHDIIMQGRDRWEILHALECRVDIETRGVQSGGRGAVSFKK